MRTVAAIAAAVLVAGCGGSGNSPKPATTAPSPTEGAVPEVRIAYQWVSAGPDLASPDGTFIRGFAESVYSVSTVGRTDVTYPGFGAANKSVDLADARSLATQSVYRRTVQFLKLADLTEQPDGTMSATVCRWGRDGVAVTQQRLVYRKTGTPPLSPQSGPADRPARDVFGDWEELTMDPILSRDPEHGMCDQVPADFTTQFNHYHDLPSLPGWPA
jgi:hypothetical protein